MTKIADHLVADVDLPEFVARLIEGVFGAIVNASIQQMKAYAKLLEDVVKSVDLPDDQLLERLARSHIRPNRQQLLATMVMMDINGIVARK